MTARPLSMLRSAALVAALGASIAACKQGEGEVCQIDEDCEEGLNCNAGTMLCQRPGGGGGLVDAAPRTDSGVPDAGLDAGLDGGPEDAGADAGEPDAAR